MMKIQIFNVETIRKLNNSNILIISDNRNISYDKESETEQYKIADELNIDLYPICCEVNKLIKSVLYTYYGDLEYWFIDKSLLSEFS